MPCVSLYGNWATSGPVDTKRFLGAVPSFSATGAKVAMQHHAGKVCATGTATQCTTAELTAGDKRSLAVFRVMFGTESNFPAI